jgi:uncharacterized metal-binding protein YceD (DUF177 family)
MSERTSERPWSVPVALADVTETGRHFDLSADEPARAAIAKLAGLRTLPRLQAAFDVALRGSGGLRVVGRVSATVGQTCVVTLEPVENEIDEDVDLVFAPAEASAMGEPIGVAAEDAPEALVNGTVDLGAVAVEFLILGIDLYPRKPGAVFEAPPTGDGSARPFAALAALKKGQGRQD